MEIAMKCKSPFKLIDFDRLDFGESSTLDKYV
jgi:hypothetical protein